MASTTSKWLVGCGVGCLAVVIVMGLILGGGVLCAKGVVNEIREVAETQKDLEEEFGEIADFIPRADGAISAERLETFLSIRESLAPLQRRMTEMFETFEGEESDNEKPALGRVLNKIKAATGALPLLGDYIKHRNMTLLEAGMGPGEYFYIHTIAYHSWLGHSPADRPENVNLEVHGGSSYWHMDDSEGERREYLHQYQSSVIALLNNQLEASAEADGSLHFSPWHERLRLEIAALERNPGRVPWEDGVPDEIEPSLVPYRTRLENSYCKVTNILDLFLHEGGSWSIEG